MTEFVLHDLPLATGQVLTLDGNSKVTVANGTFTKPIANAFSLSAPNNCPYSTEACRESCYTIAPRMQAQKKMLWKYRLNSETIRNVIMGQGWAWHDSIARLSLYAIKHAPNGFRWHVSGDIFSWCYAEWIAQVCLAAPRVPFWIYTRSFRYVPPLLGIRNLTVNLSADRDNAELARRHAEQFKLRVCYMLTDHPDDSVPDWLRRGDVIFPDYVFRYPDRRVLSLPLAQRRMLCPADLFGQSEHLRCGPCRKCTER